MYLAHALKRTASGALCNVRFTPLLAMSNAHTFHTSASLKATEAQPFSSMQGELHHSLLEGLDHMGIKNMTPVQSKVLSGSRQLRRDCLVQAKTGTGKTIAFLLPAIETIMRTSPPHRGLSILILAPTRELSLQIAAEANRLLASFERPVEVHTAYGGTKIKGPITQFETGDPKILVATPGRLKDYLNLHHIRLKFQSLQTLILDEADRMLGAGNLPNIVEILHHLPSKEKGRWQGMCFSATIPKTLDAVLSHVLNKDYEMISTLDSSEPPTLAGVEQHSIVIPSVKDTFNALYSLIDLETSERKGNPKIIIFGVNVQMVGIFAKLFREQTRLKVYEIHSGLTQTRRTQESSGFKEADQGLLFASDVVGRGMDFPNVTLVVQVGLPETSDAYTHRVGRTARAGKDGRAIILLTEAESYFLHANRQFPITTYPGSVDILQDQGSASKVSTAMSSIEDKIKDKVYRSYMGSMTRFRKAMKINNSELVQMANELALKGMKLPELPEVTQRTVRKMNLQSAVGLLRVTDSKAGIDSLNVSSLEVLPGPSAPNQEGIQADRRLPQSQSFGVANYFKSKIRALIN